MEKQEDTKIIPNLNQSIPVQNQSTGKKVFTGFKSSLKTLVLFVAVISLVALMIANSCTEQKPGDCEGYGYLVLLLTPFSIIFYRLFPDFSRQVCVK